MSPDSVAVMEREGLRVERRPALAEKPATVRIARPADEIGLFKFLTELWAHNKRGWGVPYDPATVLTRIEQGTRPEPDSRSDPTDQTRGVIGIIDGPDGKIVGSVGLFIQPAAWFTTIERAPAIVELWLYVSPAARHAARHYRDLFDFSKWSHDRLKRNLPATLPLPLHTGFQHDGEKVEPMERVWRRWSGAEKAGVLFIRR